MHEGAKFNVFFHVWPLAILRGKRIVTCHRFDFLECLLTMVVSQAHLNKVARQLNERPRKTLEFETPAERLRTRQKERAFPGIPGTPVWLEQESFVMLFCL